MRTPRPSAAGIPERVVKPWKLPPPQTYIFLNASVIDPVAGQAVPTRAVRLSGGLVEYVRRDGDGDALGPSRLWGLSAPGDDEAITVDLRGKYLCPGLIDGHVHLSSVPGEADLRSSMNLPADVSLLRQPYAAKAMLERGFTAARDCGGATLALKEAIADGVFPGPRLFIAGQALSQTGGHGDRRGAHERGCGCGGGGGGGADGAISAVCDGVPACLLAAREQLRTGADFLKIMVGGGVASPTDALGGTQFTPEEIAAVASVAEAAGTLATAHAYTPKAIRRAVEAGVRGIEHGNLLDAPTAALLAARGVFLTPTLVTYSAMADPRYAAFLPPENQRKNQAVLRRGLESLRLAHEAGVTTCLGSDLLGVLGTEQLGELGLRAKVLGAAEVLRHATVNPARMLGQEGYLGQVRAGFAADLLVLNRNPLEDITALERPGEHLLAVVKEGRVYSSRWSKLPEDVAPPRTVLE